MLKSRFGIWVVFVLLAVAALWWWPGRSDVELQFDPSVTFQTIDGFGGFGAKAVWWKPGPYYDAEFIHRLLEELGITLIRDNIPLSLEPKNDNDDPFTLDLDRFNLTEITSGSDSAIQVHFDYLAALHRAGLEKLMVSVWSPPLWMKYNQHRGNGTERQNSAPPYNSTPDSRSNQLKAEYYEEFAEYCVAYIRLLKARTGIDLYAISLQNEPRFSQFYASAVYSPKALAQLIAVVGRRFEKEGITTKIVAPEDVNYFSAVLRFLQAIIAEPDANRYTSVFAIHNYANDGVKPNQVAPSNWRETYQLASENSKAVWMTETSGFDAQSIDGGMLLATSMYNALHYGNVSAWIYWQISAEGGSSLLVKGEPTWLYDISRQFYRHIRPGAMRYQVRSSDEDVLVLAFRDERRGVDTLVAINYVSQQKTLRLPVADYQVLQTAADRRYQKVSATQGGGGYRLLLPGPSVTTIERPIP